jgi:SNF2 family DNA or RNA helicase
MYNGAVPLWKGFHYHPHQEAAIEWMVGREKDEVSPGGFLCDEMGLGKTMEILGFLKSANPQAVEHTLILMPLALVTQWCEVAHKSGFNVFHIDKKTKKWAPMSLVRFNRSFVYITHYDCALRRPKLVTRRVYDRVVFDEAHKLVNASSVLYEQMSAIEAESKWIVTATPIVNGLSDAKALFLLQGVPETEVSARVNVLQDLASKMVLYRGVDQLRQVIPNLPQKERVKFHNLPFTMDDEAEFYRAMQGAIVSRWRALEEDGMNRMEIFRLLLRLRQISVHPQVYISARKRDFPNYARADFTADSTKFLALKGLIDEQMNKSHRWIVFCHFHDEMELLKESLQRDTRIRRIQIYSGKQTSEERDKIIEKSKEEFSENQGQAEVLLLQLHAGSVGLNLQHFDRVVFLSPWWTAALMDQAVGRAVRIGQNERVEVHHLHLQEEMTMNIDAKMMAKVAEKRDLCNAFLEAAASPIHPELDTAEDPI